MEFSSELSENALKCTSGFIGHHEERRQSTIPFSVVSGMARGSDGAEDGLHSEDEHGCKDKRTIKQLRISGMKKDRNSAAEDLDDSEKSGGRG